MARRYTDTEIDELVSHVLALRMDFVQMLLGTARIPYSGLRKGELRDRVRDAIDAGEITVEAVVEFLDRVEPGGKQHVFLLRAPRKLCDEWRDSDTKLTQLRRRRALRPLLAAALPLLMPEELALSRLRFDDSLVEITGVEARRYYERDEAYDRETTSEDGLRVELRAHVERVARSTVTLRWNTNTRHAALHITQATGRGLERDHYRKVLGRFTEAVDPWLDFSVFRNVGLRKVIHELHTRERRKTNVLTRSRRGRWETLDGSELEAISPSASASVFHDTKMTAAISEVADPNSGQSGNLYWLAHDGTMTEDLHLTIIASDSRVHFMRPSTPQAVEHVIEQIRSLL